MPPGKAVRTCRQQRNIPASRLLGDSGSSMETETEYGCPDMSTGEWAEEEEEEEEAPRSANGTVAFR